MEYAELHCYSFYTFLEAASSPEDLAGRAASLGLSALALTDRDGLYGVIPFYRECLDLGVKPLIGAEVTVEEDRVVLLCRSMAGYRNLSRLITRARMGKPRGEPRASFQDLQDLSWGLVCLVGGRREGLPR
jgi:error-prone DNA polymerase